MSWLTPIPLATLAWVAAAASALTVTAYIIKTRRRRFEVPFSQLWKRVLEQKDASALWKRLRRLLSLLLALFLLALILIAALDPTLGGEGHHARSVVVLLDASASMQTRDEGDASRLDAAKRKAKELVDSMGGGDVAMIVKVDGQATPLSRFSGDGPMLRKVIDGVTPSDTPADLHRALTLAGDALRDRKNPLVVLVSDGHFPEAQTAAVRWEAAPAAATGPGQPAASKNLAAVDLSGIDVRFVPVGQRSDNVGIVAFSARRLLANREELEVFIEIQNFGAAPARRQLAIYSGEDAMDLQNIELGPGQRLRRIYKSGGRDRRLRASLRPVAGEGGSDPFALDDEAYALLSERKRQKILLVGNDNLYLDAAVLALKEVVDADKASPAEYDADPGAAARYDAVIFDEHTPAEPPPTSALYFHPSAEQSPIAVRGTIDRPRVTEIAEEHPVMRWVDLSSVHIDASEVFAPDPLKGESWLALSVRDPIVAAKRDGGRKVVVFGFPIASTDLTLRVGFPLLVVNCLDWFAGDSTELVTTYVTGQRQRVPLDGAVGVKEVTVTAPDGATTPAPVVEGIATFYARHVGFYRLAAAGAGAPALELAANLSSPIESNIAPAVPLALGGKTLEAPAEFAVTRNQKLWVYLVLAAVVLLGIEWITYHRRITV